MNYIKMFIADNRLLLEFNDHLLQYNWPVMTKGIGEISESITETGDQSDCIFAVLPISDKEILNIEFKKLGKELSEKLNCPIRYVHDIDDINNGSLNDPLYDTWTLDYYGYEPGVSEYTAETLMTTGNGFVALRGTMPEMKINDDHYTATYLAGLYNKIPSIVSGREISNEDFVNAPNFQYITVAVDGVIIDYSKEQVKELERHLDLKTGLFTASSVIQISNNKKLLITVKKFVSMSNRNQYALKYQIKPLNFSGKIKIISEADGDVYNYNVKRYRGLNCHHLNVRETKADNNYARLVVETTDSGLTVVQESILKSDYKINWDNRFSDKKIIQEATVCLKENQSFTIDKLVYVEKLMPDAKLKAHSIGGAKEISSFEEMYDESSKSWQSLWKKAHVMIKGDMMSGKMMNLHTYHLLVSASPLSAEATDASIAARGLHGEAYRGHIFWDELFILPFYILNFPETARNLLMYRYRRLNTAKDAAQKDGYEGAMYPWQSGLDGSEQTQLIHLNPMNGEWGPDNSRLQRHVSLAVAYNILFYYRNTGDVEFIDRYGLETILEIAKFWIDKAEYNDETKRYSISGIMGPDEFHEGYPGSAEGGLCDNAYTNIMVAWLFNEVTELLSDLKLIATERNRKITGFTNALWEEMKKIGRSIDLVIDTNGIIEQFDGFFSLKTVDLNAYRGKYGDIQRMDRILKAEGLSPDEYQVIKQADTMMIFYNLEKEYIDRILSNLGYNLPEDYFKKNLDYYLDRTSHGSTLSRIVHAKLTLMAGEEDTSWDLFKQSLYSDYNDIQGATVAEGIHTGVMASTIYTALNIFGGIDTRQGLLSINPSLPEDWEELKFNMTRMGVKYQISVSHNSIYIISSQDSKVFIRGKLISLYAAREKIIDLPDMER